MAKAKPACKADKTQVTQRCWEERQRQQMIVEEMKKPAEDMCLTDHQVAGGLGPGRASCEDAWMKEDKQNPLPLLFLQPLPDFSHIPGLLLPNEAFSDCLTIVEFLHSFGKVLGFDPAKDVPSLGVLQEGLLYQGDSVGEVQDLLVRLLKAALYDPGLPSHCQVRSFPRQSGRARDPVLFLSFALCLS